MARHQVAWILWPHVRFEGTFRRFVMHNVLRKEKICLHRFCLSLRYGVLWPDLVWIGLPSIV